MHLYLKLNITNYEIVKNSDKMRYTIHQLVVTVIENDDIYRTYER